MLKNSWFQSIGNITIPTATQLYNNINIIVRHKIFQNILLPSSTFHQIN